MQKLIIFTAWKPQKAMDVPEYIISPYSITESTMVLKMVIHASVVRYFLIVYIKYSDFVAWFQSEIKIA